MNPSQTEPSDSVATPVKSSDVTVLLRQLTSALNTSECGSVKKFLQTQLEQQSSNDVLRFNMHEQLLTKQHLRDMSNKTVNSSEPWLVGHHTDGISCLILVWKGYNYIINLNTNVYLRLNVPFIHTDNYDKTIIKGTVSTSVGMLPLHDTDPSKLYFVAEEVYISTGQSLLGGSFDERYKAMFDFMYNAHAGLVMVIMTLFKVKHIRTLLKDYNFPFKVNGLKFVSKDHSNTVMYTWKRSHDITLNFQIKLSDDSENPLVMFLLMNCKKPTFSVRDQKYHCYNGKVVEAMCHDSRWIITRVTEGSVSTIATHKQAMAFIKDGMLLGDICDALGEELPNKSA